MSRPSRASRQSFNNSPIPTLEHDAIAVALQAALGGRVLLIRTIGEGGMGRVYLGRDPQLKRFVAVKVLLQSQGADAEAHARFQREAQAIAAVSHANVVAIYGVGELPDGTPYFIMQYVAGGSMAERLAATGPLPIDVAESVLGDVAAALAAAHRRGIVHRDVKPANVLWDEESERATVSDFGIATLQESEGDEGDMRITASGMAVGSPAYMSPEQLLTEPITPKSDIYALGLLGYELLTGHGPYAATSPSDVVAAHLRDAPRRLSDLRAGVPPNLESLLLRCLSKSPDERPTADEVMLALTPGAPDALEWPPPGLETARGALWRLMLLPAAGAALLLVPLLLFVKLGSPGVIDTSDFRPLWFAASAMLGFAAFARGGLRAWRLRTIPSRAARLGYGWGTLAEVVSDRRGDSGSLIAGTREYSVLSARQRSGFRVLRVLQATLLFLSAPAALIVAVLALFIHSGESTAGDHFVVAVIWTLCVLVAGGLACVVLEQARLAAARRARVEFTRHTNERELAPAWYAAFERSREGQPIGPGLPVRRAVTMLWMSAGTMAIIASAAIILMATTFCVIGMLASSLIFPTTSDMFSSRLQTGLASYRLVPDGNVTPLDAGRALLAIDSTSTRRAPGAGAPAATPDRQAWRRVLPSATMFPGSNGAPWTSAAIAAAAKGLNPEQRQLLERASAHPARDQFARAARAQTADVYGALMDSILHAPLSPMDYPSAYLAGVDEAAESHAALAALDLADHHALDAERHAREIIAVGVLLLDLHLLENNLTGARVLARGSNTLEAVYVATGREHDARVLLDSIVSSAPRGRMLIRPGFEGLRRIMHTGSLTRGARMEALFPLLARSCADPKQMLFGVDDAYRSTVAYARDSLARLPSERVWVEGMGAWLAGDTPPPDSLDRGNLGIRMARILDRVVGRHRFENCSVVLWISPIY
jgi:hypothetical protein